MGFFKPNIQSNDQWTQYQRHQQGRFLRDFPNYKPLPPPPGPLEGQARVDYLQEANRRDQEQFAAMTGQQRVAAGQRQNARNHQIDAIHRHQRRRRGLSLFFAGLLAGQEAINCHNHIQQGLNLRRIFRNPAIMNEDGDWVEYGQLPGWRLFDPGGPWSNRVLQGGAGDCYLLASLAAIAVQDKQYLRSIIKDQGNGLYSVRLFAPDGQGGFAPRWITVDSRFPMANPDQLAYARVVDSPKTGAPPIWVPVIEKAFARLNEEMPIVNNVAGYDGIGNGGWMDSALRALTGQPSHSIDVGHSTDTQLWSEIQRGDRGDYVTTGTFRGRPGIVAHHAYTIIGTDHSKGYPLVKLRNPWGCCTPENPKGGGGVFSISLEIFKEYFDIITTSARKNATA
jgi:hypothetical protein